MTEENIIRLAGESGLFHFHSCAWVGSDMGKVPFSGITNAQCIVLESEQNNEKLVEILAPFVALIESEIKGKLT